MKKRLVSLLAVMTMLLSFMPVIARAATSGTCGDNLTWTLDDEVTLTISGTGDMTNWSNTSSVPWYSSRSSIKDVIIGNSVTSIGKFAFHNCDSLESVTIPNSVEIIGNYAFHNCDSLESVTIPNSVTSIGNYAFYNCDSLENITIPSSVTSIGDGTFSSCDSLTSITIPNSVTSIGDGTFSSCDSLTSITIGNSVESIGEGAFKCCQSLESVTMPDSVISIGDNAFEYCWGLASITIPNSVESIGEGAFYGCHSLTSITIPNSVESIGEEAFASCYNLTSITIGNSVESIGNNAFSPCIRLSSIKVDVHNKYFCSIDGNLYNHDKTTLIQYAIGKTDISFKVPDSVTSIGKRAFTSCNSLTSITIPNSVTSIGEKAFYYCHSLENITIPNSVEIIGNYAFHNCDSLESVTIPNSVTSIGNYAFYNCDSLTSITIPNSVTSIGTYAFDGCSSLTDVYYIGSEEQWKKISIDFGNEYLKNSIIHFLSVGVHKSDNFTIANNIEYELDTLLSSVTLCDTTIKGPTFDVAGHNICPLEFGAKAVLDFSGLSKNITIDEKNKKVHVILGKLNKDGSASVVQTTDMCDASWSKQYNEIKDLYKSMTGLNASGSDRNGVSNWNKFEKLKGELNRMECDLFVKASMECVAYLDFDYQTGYLALSEGGFIETASLGVDFRYPLIGNCLYATLGLTGSETGTIKAMVTSSGTLNPQMSIKPSITAKASITGEIPLLCKAEGGIDATLAVLLQTFDPKLTVTLGGNIFLNATVWNKKLIDWSKPYVNVQLYPEFQALSLMSFGDSTDIYDNATSVPRDYLNTVSLFLLGNGDAIYEQNRVYPDNDVHLVRLPGNAMMLVWTGDDGTKSDINRTSLMYSIYSDGVWSEVQKIAEDGTATGYFKAVSDGTTAYIVYQKLSQVLDDDTSVEDMLAATDLYMVKYENDAFDEPVCLNDYDNTSYEFIGDVSLDGDNLTIGWIENSENDVFLSEGTTSVKIRSIENDTLSDVSEITALSATEGQYPGDIHITDDTIYYAVYDASGEETTADLYTYLNEASTKLIDTDRIYNIKNIDDTLYYIKDSGIYKFENGTETSLGFDNVTSFEIVSNGDNYSLLMSVSDGARNEIYISNLSNGEWSQVEHFTDLGKYIRSYSPFMYSDGTINLAVSVAEVNDNIEEGESIYGNTSIMVLNQCDYCDISTSYIYYEEDEIQPDDDMNLYFDVNNDSANTLSSIKVALTDENGNLLDEQTVECEIAPFSTEKLNIKYHLPQNISKTQLNLTVSIDGEEKDYLNNTITTEFGYTNLSVSPIDCTVNKNNTADIKSTISNVGFTDAENVVVKVYNGSINGDVLDEINIGTMEVGEIYDLEYTFPEELMVSPDEDVMNAVYVQAETSSVEALYSDNDQKVAFDSFVKSDSSVLSTPIANTLTYTGEPQELITAGTAGGGTMQYSLDGENYSADIPTAVNAGEYTVYYKVVGDEGYNDTVPDTIDVTIEPSQEYTPCIEIDFENEMLTGFDTGSYTIDEVSIVPTENNLAIDSYIGETISIIKKASDENHADSEPQLLEIPARPSAPKEDMFTVTQPQIIGGTGTIEGITAAMEYSTDNGMTWTTGSGANITDIAGGTTYVVRYKANENNFKSDNYLIAIKIFGATDEAIPDIAIDYINETLTGFAENGNYTINGISVTPADGKLNIADYIGKTISIVKKGNGTTTNDSEAQVLAIPLRPSIPTAFEVIQPSIIDGTGTIKGISDDMEYSADNGLTWTNGNGSDITEIAGGTKYLIRVKSTDNSFKSDSYSVTITAFVAEPEQTPNICINYADEILTGFDNGNYTINGTEVTATDGKVNISPEWIGTTISIVKKGTDTTIDSNVQSLDIPARPSALNVTASPVTARGRSDGKIVGVTTDMEYKLSDSEIWLDCTDIEITGLVAGTYDVRVKSSDSSFSGIITKVEVDTECIKIIAEYTADGILEDIKVEKINISEITTSQNTTTNKVFYWETLENMKPITLTERY